MYYLTIDGMLSGTGIRDSIGGGYLNPEEIGLSVDLAAEISQWLRRYAEAHYNQFQDQKENIALDQKGIAICKKVRQELPQSKVEYFSNSEMKKIPFA